MSLWHTSALLKADIMTFSSESKVSLYVHLLSVFTSSSSYGSSQGRWCLMINAFKQQTIICILQCIIGLIDAQPHPVISGAVMEHIALKMQQEKTHWGSVHVAAKYVCVQLNRGEGDSLEAKWGLIVANLVLFHADMNKSVTGLRRIKSRAETGAGTRRDILTWWEVMRYR